MQEIGSATDVKVRLARLGKTQVDLAEASGLNIHTLRATLNGFRVLSKPHIKLISHGLDILEGIKTIEGEK